jgi:SAM-dependent methyltransferase
LDSPVPPHVTGAQIAQKIFLTRARGGPHLRPSAAVDSGMFAKMLRTNAEERLDREGLSPRGLDILRQLDTWNRRTGWYAAHIRRIRRHWEALGRPSPLRILDVGTGTGGLVAALVASDLPCIVTGLDRSTGYLAQARERVGTAATFVEGDATALPFPDGAFDLVTNTLMLHHLPREVRTGLVSEAARVARSTYLFDLEVTLYGTLGVPVFGPLFGLGRDGVHDGMISVRRGSTLAEFRALCVPLPVRVVRVFPSALCTLPA